MSETTGTTTGTTTGPPGSARALALLHAGVPLSLLLDLAAPVHSEELMRAERADTSWVRAVA